MHQDDVLHLENKLQSSSCSTDPKVLSSLRCKIHKVNWCSQVKSQNSVHTSQFVENNRYYIFDTLNSKWRFGWHLKAVNIIGKRQQPEKILRARLHGVFSTRVALSRVEWAENINYYMSDFSPGQETTGIKSLEIL